MAFWHRKDKRLKKKAARKTKKAAKKTEKAIAAASKGNTKRSEKLLKKADKLTLKANQNIFWERCVFETTKSYYPTVDQVETLKQGIMLARQQAAKIRPDITAMTSMLDNDKLQYWKSKPLFTNMMGSSPSLRELNRVLKVCNNIVNVLENQIMYIALREDKKYFGKTMPSILNRPLSNNFRCWLDLPSHKTSITGVANTIVHEIAHLNVTNDKYFGKGAVGTLASKDAVKDVRSYAALFGSFI